MGESSNDHFRIRHTDVTHVSVRDGWSFSYHLNSKYLIWLSLDRPLQKQIQYLSIMMLLNCITLFLIQMV